jgi:YspA, cpYpsA-related SLOG family
VKTIIAGSRGITSYALIQREMEPLLWEWKISQVVSGGARGVDQLGEQWAKRNNIPVVQFIPNWNGYAGKRAGLVRNVRMAEYAQALVAFWDGRSRGTKHMIETAQQRGLRVHVVRCEPLIVNQDPYSEL